MLNKFIFEYFKEPYVNVICVETGQSIVEYRRKRTINIIVGIVLSLILLSMAVVVKNAILIVVAILVGYFFYRKEYLQLKAKERQAREELKKIYPLFVQTFISLLYGNDNLIKVFLLLEQYHFHPYIDRALIILINKYQQDSDNSELIFAEFCSIFEVTSSSLLHQLLVNISRYGVNDKEVRLIEMKVEQESVEYTDEKIKKDSNKILQISYMAIIIFTILFFTMVVASI